MLVPGVTVIGPPAGYGNSGVGKKYVAWHNTSNDASPVDEARYAKRRTDNVSSHIYADAADVVQSLDTRYDAWHAGSRTGNTKAIALELVGTNASSADHWRAVIDQVAPAVAAIGKAHGIPARWLTVAELQAGQASGWCTHDDMRQAWGGTTHTDPGPHFPKAYAAQAVSAHLTASPEDDMGLTPAEFDQIVRGSITPDNALFYWLRRIAEGANPVDGKPDGVGLPQLAAQLTQLTQAAAADEVRDKAMLAVLNALTSGGTSVDTSAVVAAIQQARDDLGGQLAELRQRVVAAEQERDELRGRLAAALGQG